MGHKRSSEDQSRALLWAVPARTAALLNGSTSLRVHLLCAPDHCLAVGGGDAGSMQRIDDVSAAVSEDLLGCGNMLTVRDTRMLEGLPVDESEAHLSGA
jgi:hypothetical protein